MSTLSTPKQLWERWRCQTEPALTRQIEASMKRESMVALMRSLAKQRWPNPCARMDGACKTDTVISLEQLANIYAHAYREALVSGESDCPVEITMWVEDGKVKCHVYDQRTGRVAIDCPAVVHARAACDVFEAKERLDPNLMNGGPVVVTVP